MAVTIQPLTDRLGYQVLVNGKLMEAVYASQDGQVGTFDIHQIIYPRSRTDTEPPARQIGRVTAECAPNVLLEHAETSAWILARLGRES